MAMTANNGNTNLPKFLSVPSAAAAAASTNKWGEERIAYHQFISASSSSTLTRPRQLNVGGTANTTKSDNSNVKQEKNGIRGVIFCSGFRSAMTGNKTLALEAFCRNQNLSFTRFDYRGHGQSYRSNYVSNKESDSTISENAYFESLVLGDWIADTNQILELCVQTDPEHRPHILVGSSMGAWIALHVALIQPAKVAGIIGIAAAPDFTQDIWDQLTPQQLDELNQQNRVLLPSEYSTDPYPISKNLLEDGSKWLLLPKDKQQHRINVHCPVRLIHGHQDIDIPWDRSTQIVHALATDDAQVRLVKSGDHRLSRPEDLDLICSTLEELIDSIG